MTNEAVADLERHLLAEHRNGSRKPSADADELIPRSKSESPNHNSKLGRDGAPGFFLKQPGGFRREFLHSKADADGVPESARPSAWSKSLLESVRPLIRVGYFESVLGISESGERMQLRTSGEAGLAGTSVALLKGFLGSGVTFMPGVFGKGGWALASGSLVVAGVLSFLCIRLLLACRDKVDAASYGEIARAACGKPGELVVEVSLVVLQFGGCIGYLIFVMKTAASLGLGAPGGILAAELAVLLPLCLLRSVDQLEVTNLLADLLIVGGLVAILSAEVASPEEGTHTLVSVRTDSLAVVFGTVIGSFEGIPMILPIRNAMREPARFPQVLAPVFTFIVALAIFFGFAGYASFGAGVEMPVMLSLPPALWVAEVKAGYCVALMLTIPLVFIPVARITEFWAFGITSAGSRKWSKNSLRACELALFGLIAIGGASQFDVFIGFVGGAIGTPISLVYPALFHMILCAETLAAKLMDAALLAVGVCTVAFVVQQSL
jgi:proton-coupled amino acid transporter